MKRRLHLALILAIVSIAHALIGARLHAQTKFGITAGGASGGGSGTVTSVAATVPGEITLTGSPITGSGTLAFSWANQLQNKVFAAPCSSTGTPTFRVLCAADIPTLDPSKITGTAVVDADARLTNARTPTAHASTHASVGSDPVTLAESQVTGLTAALAGKQATGSYVTSLTGDVVASGPGAAASTIQANSVALGTDTTGGYAGSSTEGGSATTADALAANGTNCSAPNFGRGVDAAGNCEGAAIVATDLPSTAVTPGAYTSANITVDQQGRITSAANGSGGVGGSTGATDNAVLRADGTGGATVQSSTVTISDTGSITTTGTANRIGTATTNDTLADTMFTASTTARRALTMQSLVSAAESTMVVQNSAGAMLFAVGAAATGSTPAAIADVRIGITGDGAGLTLTEKTTGSNRSIAFGINNTRATLLAFGSHGLGFDDTSATLKSTGCYGFVSNTTLTSGANDTCIWRDGVAGVRFAGATAATKGYTVTTADANGSAYSRNSSTEALTLSTGGATTNTSGSIAAANADVKAILVRVTTTIATATDWSIAVTSGIASCTTAWVATGTTTSAQTALTAGTTVTFRPASGLQCHTSTAATITVTTTGTPSAGALRITPVYEQFTPPTS